MAHLQDYLREKHLLLLLDNFEQVLPAARLIADLLQAAPQLKVVVTSRAPLRLAGEQEVPVPPLTLPTRVPPSALTPDVVAQSPAVELFVQRAQAVQPDFVLISENVRAVLEICIQLDGLPLAIELAAARSKVLPPPMLLTRLNRRLSLLTGGAVDQDPRHRTLRGTIDWSYQLLDAAEQTLFRRLAAFVGGWTLEAAEAVCNVGGELPWDMVDGITSLLDKSLVQHRAGSDVELRFTMLETIREYALEQLEVHGEAETIRRLHAAYYMALAEAAEPKLQGQAQKE